VRVVLNSCSGRLWLRVIIAEDAVCSSSDEGHDALIELFNQRFDVSSNRQKLKKF
jgi:nicotinamidase-related amidase